MFKVIGRVIDNRGIMVGVRLQNSEGYADFSMSQFDLLVKSGVVYNNIPDVRYKVSDNGILSDVKMTVVQRFLSKNIITLYHGSSHDDVQPLFENYSDGGFCVTPSKEIARELAWSDDIFAGQAYMYTYSLDKSGLRVLDFTSCDSLNWVAELLATRRLNLDSYGAHRDSITRFVSKYKLDTSKYDVLVGYQNDNSCFECVKDFITGMIFRGTLDAALQKSNSSIQILIRSQLAFSKLTFVSRVAVDDKYKDYFLKRDKAARAEYSKLKASHVDNNKFTVGDYI